MQTDRRTVIGMLCTTLAALAAGRRTALAGLAGTTFPGSPTLDAAANNEMFFAALKSLETHRFGLGLLAEDRTTGWTTEVEARLHGGAARPGTHELAVIARRPGLIAIVVDVRDGRIIRTLPACLGRFYLGHASFDAAGDLMFVSEAVTETAAGMIGVYDARQDYRRVAEWATHGTDPHEVLLSADGRMLWVANGGVELHPETGRAILNEGAITSSLVALDLDGRPRQHVSLPADAASLSIRHIALTGSGGVVIGCQDQADPRADLPIVWHVGTDGRAAPVAGTAVSWLDLNGYIGSIAVDASGETVLATSPRGNRAIAVSLADPSRASVLDAFDVGGVAPLSAPGRFLLTTGSGLTMEVSASADGSLVVERTSTSTVQWDNHIIRG